MEQPNFRRIAVLLTNGASQLAAGVGQLDSKSSELLAGSNQLASGLGELNGKMPALTSV